MKICANTNVCNTVVFFSNVVLEVPIPLAERSNARGCDRLLVGVAGSNPAWSMDVCIVFKVNTKRRNVGQPRQRNKYG